MNRLINFIAELPVKIPHIIVFIFLILAGISLYSMTNMKIKLSFFDELPSDHPQVLRFKDVSEKYGGVDNIFFILEGDNLSDLKVCAEEIEDILRKIPEIKSVRGKLPIDFIKQHALLFIEEKNLNEIVDFLKRRENEFTRLFDDLRFTTFIRNWSALMEEEILSREEIKEEDEEDFILSLLRMQEWVGMMKDYFRTGQIDEQRYRSIMRKIFLIGGSELENEYSDFYSGEDYLISKDLSTLVIFATPIRPSDDYDFNKLIYRRVTDIRSSLSEGKCKNVNINIGGSYIALEEQRLKTLRDMRLTMIISLSGILVLFIFIFRGFFSLATIMLHLGIGLFLSFGFLMLLYGYVTIISALFGSFLLGLGIDFGVYVLSRWREFVEDGENIKRAVYLAVKNTIAPMFIGAVTTGAAFYTVSISDIQGAKILSVIAGTGIFIYFISGVLFVSSLISVFGKFLVREKFSGVDSILAPTSKFISRFPYPVFALVLLLISLSVYGLRKFGFEYNIRKILPELDAIKAEDKLVKKFGRPKDFTILVSDSLDELDRKIEELRKKSTVKYLESIRIFYPKDMQKKIPLVSEVDKVVGKIGVADLPNGSGESYFVSKDELLQSFRSLLRVASALTELSILSGTFKGEDISKQLKGDIEGLMKMIEESKDGNSLDVGKLQYVNAGVAREIIGDLKISSKSDGFDISDVPEDISKTFIGKDGSYIIFAYPGRAIWEDEKFMRKIREEMEEVDKTSFSIISVFLDVTDRAKRDFFYSLTLGFVVVFLLVYLGFRSFIRAIFAYIPVALSLFTASGILSLLGVKIHYIDMGTYALLLGAGVDYGVHIVHRLSDEKGDIVRAILGTGRAITVAALTTVIGFGSLMFAIFPGLRDFGEVLFVGILITLFISVFFTPAFFKLLKSINLIKV